jgi:hypothetical protein
MSARHLGKSQCGAQHRGEPRRKPEPDLGPAGQQRGAQHRREPDRKSEPNRQRHAWQSHYGKHPKRQERAQRAGQPGKNRRQPQRRERGQSSGHPPAREPVGGRSSDPAGRRSPACCRRGRFPRRRAAAVTESTKIRLRKGRTHGTRRAIANGRIARRRSKPQQLTSTDLHREKEQVDEYQYPRR